jgi:hypothetical protein
LPFKTAYSHTCVASVRTTVNTAISTADEAANAAALEPTIFAAVITTYTTAF